MLDKIKLAMRIKSNAFDDEIETYIVACESNLTLAGIDMDNIAENDETIVALTSAYVKWQMDFQGKGDKWEQIYKQLRLSVALDTRYKA